jgi:hypothetical protein
MNPMLEFQKIFDYLRLPIDSTIQSYIEKYTSGNNPVEVESEEYQPRNAMRSLDTWKKRLTTPEIDRVRAATRDIATEFYKNLV